MSQYQIRIRPGGKWHRRKHGSTDLTACGEAILGAVASRDWELDLDLCPECFSRHEITTGEMVKLERERELEADVFGDEEQTTDPDAEGIDDTVADPEKPPTT